MTAGMLAAPGLRHIRAEPGFCPEFYDRLFASWHAALAAEAAVLAGDARAGELLRRADTITAAHTVPGLISRRALALHRNEHAEEDAAAAFAALEAPYQVERSRALTTLSASRTVPAPRERG